VILQKLKSLEVFGTQLPEYRGSMVNRITWITLVRLFTWKSTNDKSVRSERMEDGTPRTIAIESRRVFLPVRDAW